MQLHQYWLDFIATIKIKSLFYVKSLRFKYFDAYFNS